MMPFADKLNLTRQVAFKVNRDFELILYCCVQLSTILFANVLRVKCVGRRRFLKESLMPPQSVEPSKDNTVTICAMLKAKIAK